MVEVNKQIIFSLGYDLTLRSLREVVEHMKDIDGSTTMYINYDNVSCNIVFRI